MTHQQDAPREQLLRRVIARFPDRDETTLARRIARMSDQQVARSLAMTDEEATAAMEDRSHQYAPATSSAPVYLWYH